MDIKEQNGFKARGYLEILDVTDPDDIALLAKKNAIHEGNMVYAIARALSGNDDTASIGWFAFGDGGSEIANTGRITYRPTNTSLVRNEQSDLYNRVFQKHIDDAGLDVTVSPVVHPTAIADININVMLYMGEPSGQLPMDNASEFGENFVFDEIGIFTNDPNPNNAMLLTHVIFHPIQKSLNRTIQIKYTIRFEIV